MDYFRLEDLNKKIEQFLDTDGENPLANIPCSMNSGLLVGRHDDRLI